MFLLFCFFIADSDSLFLLGNMKKKPYFSLIGFYGSFSDFSDNPREKSIINMPYFNIIIRSNEISVIFFCF